MSQTSMMAAALTIAWIIFITVRGELPAYLGALGIGPQAEKPSVTTVSVGTTSGFTTVSYGGGYGSPTIGVGVGIPVGGGTIGIGGSIPT